MEQAQKVEDASSGTSALSAGLERRVTELAEWFSDNPNTNDIADALRVLVRDVGFAERKNALLAILDGCPDDGSDAEIILRRAWDRVRRMRSNVKVRGAALLRRPSRP